MKHVLVIVLMIFVWFLSFYIQDNYLNIDNDNLLMIYGAITMGITGIVKLIILGDK